MIMKKILSIPHSIWIASLLLLSQTGCKDNFLVEKPVTTLTTDTYYKT